ncbi:MAG TPA: COX15/CtaA family protein [Pyrinomonadaceae bacterium]|nr:COX15/CtaA family protein [Pyrinomonadaceae bacterium]
MTRFAKFAWFTLAYNILVIIWGVFLRASKSGDGCGQHWLTCQGEVIPSAPQLKTIIEFSHRMTTGPAFIFVLVLLVWAFVRFGKGSPVSKAAAVSFLFIITEVLIGAVLVLTGNTAEAQTSERPFLAIGHLINSSMLIGSLAMTAWFAGGDRRLKFDGKTRLIALLGVGVLVLLLSGISGSVAALSSMLFPSETLVEGVAKDFEASSNILLRLRVSHPLLAIFTSVYLIFLSGWIRKASDQDPIVSRWSNILSVLVLCQLAFGAATFLMLGPIVMQVGHLLLADLLWISFVLLSANYLGADESSVQANLSE